MGCGRIGEQASLVRLVRTPEGELVVSRTAAGRGAWLCAESPDCLAAAVRKKAFARAFRADIRADSAEALRAQL